MPGSRWRNRIGAFAGWSRGLVVGASVDGSALGRSLDDTAPPTVDALDASVGSVGDVADEVQADARRAATAVAAAAARRERGTVPWCPANPEPHLNGR
jgi:hypothetical protein